MLIELKRKIVFQQSTPISVIEYLLKTLGKNIEREKILNKLEKIKKYYEEYNISIDTSEKLTENDYEKISIFVSSTEENWEKETLKKSFNNLINWEKELDLENLEFGIRTNKNPYKVDIVMLYQICLILKIDTKLEDTFEDLQDKFYQKKLSREKIINNIRNNLFEIDDYKLLNISNFIEEKNSPFEYKEEELKNLSSKININYIINRSLISKNEAVIYAAKFFSIDITDSKNPIEVLNKLSNSDCNFNFNDLFSKNYKINENFYRLEKFWRKNISFLYTPKILNSIKKCEFLNESDDTENLNKKLTEKNFYIGRIPGVHQIEEKEDVISYGIIENKDLKNVDLENLNTYFLENKSFGKYSTNINKLLVICKDLSGEIYEKLFDTITYIKKYCIVMDGNVEKLIGKENIISIFKKLYDLSLLISDKKNINDLENLSIKNTSEEIVKEIEDSDESSYLKNLFILNYKNKKFVKASENYYSTIYEDLKSLVSLTEKSEEYITTKSNYYKYSSYYYCYIIKKEEIFDLGE